MIIKSNIDVFALTYGRLSKISSIKVVPDFGNPAHQIILGLFFFDNFFVK